MSEEKLYELRKIDEDEALDGHCMKHMLAMTAEGLDSKSAIAAELAYRDMIIERLRNSIEELEEVNLVFAEYVVRK